MTFFFYTHRFSEGRSVQCEVSREKRAGIFLADCAPTTLTTALQETTALVCEDPTNPTLTRLSIKIDTNRETEHSLQLIDHLFDLLGARLREFIVCGNFRPYSRPLLTMLMDEQLPQCRNLEYFETNRIYIDSFCGRKLSQLFRDPWRGQLRTLILRNCRYLSAVFRQWQGVARTGCCRPSHNHHHHHHCALREIEISDIIARRRGALTTEMVEFCALFPHLEKLTLSGMLREEPLAQTLQTGSHDGLYRHPPTSFLKKVPKELLRQFFHALGKLKSLKQLVIADSSGFLLPSSALPDLIHFLQRSSCLEILQLPSQSALFMDATPVLWNNFLNSTLGSSSKLRCLVLPQLKDSAMLAELFKRLVQGSSKLEELHICLKEKSIDPCWVAHIPHLNCHFHTLNIQTNDTRNPDWHRLLHSLNQNTFITNGKQTTVLQYELKEILDRNKLLFQIRMTKKPSLKTMPSHQWPVLLEGVANHKCVQTDPTPLYVMLQQYNRDIFKASFDRNKVLSQIRTTKKPSLEKLPSDQWPLLLEGVADHKCGKTDPTPR